MNKIKLNDGTEYSVISCGENRGNLYITISQNLGVKDTAEVFGSPDKTERIECKLGDDAPIVYDGYTELFGVMIEDTMKWTQVYLTKKEGG